MHVLYIVHVVRPYSFVSAPRQHEPPWLAHVRGFCQGHKDIVMIDHVPGANSTSF